METVSAGNPNPQKVLKFLEEFGPLHLHDITTADPLPLDEREILDALGHLERSGLVQSDSGFYSVVGYDAPVKEDPIGQFRKDFLSWLDDQEAWQQMPPKQRGVIATAIKRHLSQENGLFVGPKPMAREYRGNVSQRTIRYALKTLTQGELLVSIGRKRPNGSSTTSARFPSPAFYAQLGLPVPNALAEHLGIGVVVPLSAPVRTAVAAVAVGVGGQ